MRTGARIALALLLLTACGKGDKAPSPSAGAAPGMAIGSSVAPSAEMLRALAVTEVPATTRVDAVPAGPVVVVTDKSIVIDGTALAAVTGGAVEAAALDGASMQIKPVKTWAESWVKTRASAGPLPAVSIAIAPGVPSSLLIQVLASFNAAGARDFGLIVRTPDGPGAVPLHLPVARRPPDEFVAPDKQPIKMVLSLSPAHAYLWSISGLEGTLANPKLDLTPSAGGAWLTTVRDDLADIVKRRWEGGTRPADQDTIVIMIDDALAAGDLVAAAAAVRHDARGETLFPDVQIAQGFQSPPVKKPDIKLTESVRPSHDQAVALQEDAARYVAMLTADVDDGATEGDMARRQPGADLSAQLNEIRDGSSQVAVGGGRGTRGDGDPRTGVAKGPNVDGPGGTAGSGAAPTTPSGRISISAKQELEDSSLTADVVVRKMMSAYMAGLKRCYKNELKQDPALHGKIKLSITVNESGRSVRGKADAPNPDLATCVEGIMSSWTFPIPKDEDGEATEASFVITLYVVPD